MGYRIAITLPHLTAATAFCAIAGLSACQKNESATTDSTTAMTATDSTAMAPGAMNNAVATGATMTDAQIFGRLEAANQGEIDAGKMAESKATNADVKAFARMMVTDHGKMLSDGMALAKRLNITPDPMAADSLKIGNQTIANTLSAAPKGMTFDTAYVNAQVVGHQATLDMLKNAASQAQNADLKQALNAAIPMVQRHLDRIKTIQGKME